MTHLHLNQIGYKQLREILSHPETLHYRVIRPVRIPITMTQHPNAEIGAVPLNMGISSHESYYVTLSCDLYFQLQQDIATAVYISGQRC